MRAAAAALGPLVAILAAPRGAAGASSIVKGPWVQRVTSTSAVVRVEVDPPAPASVELGLGPSADAGRRVFESAEPRSLHAITLSDLMPGRRYAYAVKVGERSKRAAFVTAPRDDGDAPFRFLVYGDNRTDDAAHAAVVRAMVPVASDFLLHTGDFVENGAATAQWQRFFEIEAPLLGARALFSCVGNHELTDGAGIEYARYFGPTDPSDASRPPGAPAATKPEHLDGTFRWGSARFFLLNGMVSFKGSPARAWLEEALAASDAEPGIRWRVVVVHHGPWSSGPHGGNTRLHDAGVPALLVAHKVDLVISGHDHIYERGWADGLAYLVSGGGGAPLYKVKAPIPQARKIEAARHFVEVDVSPMALQIAALRSDGSTLERCALPKSAGGWRCDEAAASAPAPATSERAHPAPPASPPPAGAPAPATSRCACEVVGAPAPTGPSAAAALAAIAIVAGLRRRSRGALRRSSIVRARLTG